MAREVLVDMTGLRYGRLVGLAYSHRGSSGHAHWHFSCDCGTMVTVDGSEVRSGNSTSCGCRHREISAARLLVHGHRAAQRHGAGYRAWQTMKDGCYNLSSPRFKTVGARGIGVCVEWLHDYERFFADMGRRPRGTTLARVDVELGYGRGNCVWVVTPSRADRAATAWTRRRGGLSPDPADRSAAASVVAVARPSARPAPCAPTERERDGAADQAGAVP